ncbi:MAG: hypothetical protein KAX24_06085 [Anaerolineae bacterium]|nr:hypothetical protein [Anaerolineae bacterium]
MTRRVAKRGRKRDERLPNGSTIYWSRRFGDGRYASGGIRWRVPVRCGRCGQMREVDTSTAMKSNFTGLCHACATFKVQISRSTLEHLYHEENLTQREIAERLGCVHHTAVARRMIEHGIKARPQTNASRTLVPEEVLQQWSPELAYVVGLVVTDGNLEKRRGNVVSFSSTDHQLIETYQQCLGVSAHVVTTTDRRPGRLPRHQVTVSDPAYRRFLEDVGLTPAKTKERTLGALKVPDEFFRDFLRGAIDGSIFVRTDKRWPHSHRLVVSLTSVCRPFLVWVRDTIVRLVAVENTVRQTERAFTLTFTGTKARRLLSWLYYAPDLPCLQRKRAVWEAYMRGY